MARSSSGLGYKIFILVTRIRIPHALQFFIMAHSSNGEDTAESMAEMVRSSQPWATEICAVMALSSIGRTKGSQPLKTDSTPVGATRTNSSVVTRTFG